MVVDPVRKVSDLSHQDLLFGASVHRRINSFLT